MINPAEENASAFADDFDVQGEGGASAPPASLEIIHGYADDAMALETLIASREEELSALKASLQLLRTVKMPAAMIELQMPEFTYGELAFSLSDFVSGSFPKDEAKRNKALELLREYKAEGLLKSEISIEFPRSQHEQAVSAYEEFKARGLAVSLDTTINTATLQAFARARIRDGEPIDPEGLGLFTGKVVKYGLTKEAKKKAKAAQKAQEEG